MKAPANPIILICKGFHTSSQSNGPYLLVKVLSSVSHKILCGLSIFSWPASQIRRLSSSIFALLLQRLEYVLRCPSRWNLNKLLLRSFVPSRFFPSCFGPCGLPPRSPALSSMAVSLGYITYVSGGLYLSFCCKVLITSFSKSSGSYMWSTTLCCCYVYILPHICYLSIHFGNIF